MGEDALNEQQKAQEEEYIFPYHYLDMVPHIRYLETGARSFRNFVLKLLAPYTGQSVLDAGCGDGRLCYDMRKENLKVTGIDYSQRAIGFARAFCPDDVEFIVGDLTKYRFEKQFDYIILTEVLEHIEPCRISQVLASLSSSLAQKGKLIVTVPSTRLKVAGKHYQHFTTDKLKISLRPYFEVESMYGFNRRGLRHIICGRMLQGCAILKLLQWDTVIARPYFWLADRLHKTIEECPPEKGNHIVAVCKKTL